MNYLVIAEKSEVGKAIDSAIKHFKYDPSNEYRVTAASGHLLTLKAPEDYDEKYKTWNIKDLPIAFPAWELVPKKDSENTHGMVAKKLATIEEGLDWCDAVIHAGDPDAEGQLIVDELCDYFHNTKPVYRLDVNDSTEAYIIKMLDKMQSNEPMRPQGRSAYARTVADAVFGYNYSRWYTVSYNSNTPLSVGRVQTPTLGLVVKRDREIDNHIEQHYYILEFTAHTKDGKTFPMTLELPKNSPLLEDGKVLNKDTYKELIEKINGTDLPAVISKKNTTDKPPLPFNLVELQSYCSSNYGYSPEEVHNITQSLRGNALITYNRSSCQYLHEFQHAEAPNVLKSVFSNIGKTAPVDTKLKSQCFNDKYLEGEPHHAIIPTNSTYDLFKLSEKERKVYQAICLYYIVQFMNPRTKLQTNAVIDLGDGIQLKASAAVTIENGYYGYMHDGKTDDKPSDLNDLPEGKTTLTIDNPDIQEKKTAPPKRYTQASLIKDMTAVAKYVTDPRIKQLLIDKDEGKQKENGSIGTPATRDKIVQTLIKRGYLTEKKTGKTAHLESTDLGKSFYDLLPESVRSLNTTAEWWVITEEIRLGKSPETVLYDCLLGQVNDFLNDPPAVQKLKGMSSGTTELGKCPHCGGTVVKGKVGAYCSEKCGFVLKSILKKDLTDNQISALLAGKKVSMKGLAGKDNKTFEAVVVPNGVEERKVEKDGEEKLYYSLKFDLEFADKKLGKCPHCGGAVVKGKNGAFCSGKCGFIIKTFMKKRLTDAQITSLLDGKTTLIQGLTSSAGKTFDAEVTPTGVDEYKMAGDDGKRIIYTLKCEMKFPDKTLGKCPHCGEPVTKGANGAFCTAKCGFGLKSILKKDLTDSQITLLLEGKTIQMKGLSSNSGKTFDANIVPTGVEERKVEKDGVEKTYYSLKFDLQFPDNSLGTCPKCGETLRKGEYGAYCSGKCGFSIRPILGKKLTDSQIKSLIEGKKTMVIGLESKAGKTFDAYLVPKGIEDFSYEKDGKTITGSSLKFDLEFPQSKKKS